MEKTLSEINNLIADVNPTVVVCVADSCPYCVELKSSSNEIKEFAESNNLNLEFFDIAKSENQEFLKKYPFETLPYALVFVDGDFKGGDNASKEMLEQLIPLLNRKESA